MFHTSFPGKSDQEEEIPRLNKINTGIHYCPEANGNPQGLDGSLGRNNSSRQDNYPE